MKERSKVYKARGERKTFAIAKRLGGKLMQQEEEKQEDQSSNLKRKKMPAKGKQKEIAEDKAGGDKMEI